MLVAPFLFFYAAFLIYPAIEVAYLSLTDSDITGQGAFVGLRNYRELIGDADFWASLWHTLYFIALTVVPNTVAGFLLALLVVRLKRLRLPVLSAFFLPFVLPVSVVTTGALWLLDTNFGIINYLVGSSISWFQDPNWPCLRSPWLRSGGRSDSTCFSSSRGCKTYLRKSMKPRRSTGQAPFSSLSISHVRWFGR